MLVLPDRLALTTYMRLQPNVSMFEPITLESLHRHERLINAQDMGDALVTAKDRHSTILKPLLHLADTVLPWPMTSRLWL